MKAFRERFKQHPLQASLNDLWAAIEKVRLPKYSEGEVSEDLETLRTRRDAFARFLRVSSFVAHTIDHTDASIWTPSAMNVAQTAVNELNAGLDQFNATRAVAHLESSADTALDQFRTAYINRLSIHSKETSEAFTKFCEKAEKAISSLEDTDAAIKAMQSEIAASKTSFSEKLEAFRAQLDGFKGELEAQKTRIDALVTTQQEAFQTAQAERTNLYTQEAEARKATYEQWAKDSDEKLAVILKVTQTSAETHLVEMEEQKARAKEILGIVAASGVSGHYQKTANREFWSAEILRGIALLFFLGMISMVAYVVFTLKGDKFEWQMGLFRVGVGLALLAPAYYCTRESSKHREAEKRNRRLQIELATIAPYLENLNDVSERQAIFKQKAEGYFLGQLQKEPSDNSDGDLHSKESKQMQAQVMDLLQAALAAAVRK